MDLLASHVTLADAAKQIKPVTLPYTFHIPPQVEPIDTSAVPQIESDTGAFLGALDQKHHDRIESFLQFKKELDAQKEMELRQKAPGFSGILEPSKRTAAE